jgi:cob(I)alamin adenosyltransferase
MRDNPASVDIELAEEGFAKAKEVIQSGDYDMVILDEINVVADFCLVPEEDLIELIKNKPAELDLILTGRYASQRIQDLADMASKVMSHTISSKAISKFSVFMSFSPRFSKPP